MAQLTTPTKAITKVVIDPVCGMNVSPGKKDLVAKYEGSIYYFCAEGCRKAFEMNPQKYLESNTAKRKGWWARYLERLNRTTGSKPLKCH
jgi:YHS domain-containing protein